MSGVNGEQAEREAVMSLVVERSSQRDDASQTVLRQNLKELSAIEAVCVRDVVPGTGNRVRGTLQG